MRWFSGLRWWKKIIVLLVFLLGVVIFMDTIAMPFYTRHGEEYQLPDVSEKDITEARRILEDGGFIPIIQDSVFDETYPRGTVVRQNPLPFATVKKGRRIYLVVSSGEKPVYMPDLVNESQTNAELHLRELGLQLGELHYDYSTQVPYRGVVVSQSVAAGERVPSGAAIDLTISLGAPPSTFAVPNLVGKSLEAGLKELEANSISSERVHIKTRYQPNLVPQTIVSQSLPGGTPAGQVETIELTVSTDQLPERKSAPGGTPDGR